jgi:quinol monooxygenase YgiN
MVGIEILVRINPEKRVEFLQAFDMLKHLDQLGDNRIDLELFEQIWEPNTFLWLEHWDNNESLTTYYQDNKYKAMMGAIDIMGQMKNKRIFTVKEERRDG